MKVMTAQEKIEDRKLTLEALLGNKSALRLYRKNTFKLQLLLGTVGVVGICLIFSILLYLISKDINFIALLKGTMLWFGMPISIDMIFWHYFITLEYSGTAFMICSYNPYIIYAFLHYISEDTALIVVFSIFFSICIVSAYQKMMKDSVIEKLVAELRDLGVEVILPEKEIKYIEIQKDSIE